MYVGIIKGWYSRRILMVLTMMVLSRCIIVDSTLATSSWNSSTSRTVLPTNRTALPSAGTTRTTRVTRINTTTAPSTTTTLPTTKTKMPTTTTKTPLSIASTATSTTHSTTTLPTITLMTGTSPTTTMPLTTTTKEPSTSTLMPSQITTMPTTTTFPTTTPKMPTETTTIPSTNTTMPSTTTWPLTSTTMPSTTMTIPSTTTTIPSTTTTIPSTTTTIPSTTTTIPSTTTTIPTSITTIPSTTTTIHTTTTTIPSTTTTIPSTTTTIPTTTTTIPSTTTTIPTTTMLITTIAVSSKTTTIPTTTLTKSPSITTTTPITTKTTHTATSEATNSQTTITPAATSTNCGVPDKPDNGLVYYNSTTLHSMAIYNCKSGYTLNGANGTICLESGEWDTQAPNCTIKDCGQPPGLQNGMFELLGGTTFSAIAIYSCGDGFKLNGTNSKTICDMEGFWTGAVGFCIPIVCRDLENPLNGNVTYSSDKKKAEFSCSDGYIRNGIDKLFCQSDGTWNGKEPECITVAETTKVCQKETDYRGTVWNETFAGQIVSLPCKNAEGSISRICTLNGNWKRPAYSCIKKEISQAEIKISAIENSNVTDEVKSETVSDVLGALSNSTKQSTESDSSSIYDGEIKKVTSILGKVANISHDISISKGQSQNFIDTTSSLLDQKNIDAYKSLDEERGNQTGTKPSSAAGKVLEVVGTFIKAIANGLDKLNGSRTITSPNMVVTVEKIEGSSEVVRFPETPFPSSNSSAELNKTDFEGIESYSGIYYKNLSGMLPPTVYENGNLKKESYEINTAVIDMNLINTSTAPGALEINLHFEHFISGDYERKCAFWNFSRNTWDTSGCLMNKQMSNDDFTVCSCNHLTNFAILMNPYKTANVDSKAMDYITIAGCSISVVCLVINCVVHALLWRYLKSDRAVILMNLSVALIISYVLFIGGVDRIEYMEVCVVIAASLHYIYLVVFFLMLAEGVEILITVVYVFIMKSRRRWLLVLSWGLPLVIVGTALGVTKTDGYGSNEVCWLSVNGGVIWAFVGPAITVIVINFIILFIVVKTMFTAKTLKEKAMAEKVKTGVRCLCVLIPLTGGTWVIGVFYVNERQEWIQYLFAIINSLQGASILICHCIMNSQVKIAISRRVRRYRATSSMSQSRNTPISIPRPTKTAGMYQNLFESSTDSYEAS